MDVEPALVADRQPAEAVEPSKTALDDPPVTAELLRALDAAPGDARSDVSAPASVATATVVVGFVGVQLVGSATRPAALASNRRNGVDQRLEGHAIMDVCASQIR
jgi:hypothetical protein